MLNIGVMFRNNEHLIYPFFFFLRKSTDLPLKVYAVDQASTDSTNVELKKHLVSKNDQLITLPENVCSAEGRNIIVDAAVPNDVFLIDSDCFISRRYSLDNMMNTIGDLVYGKTIHFYSGATDEQGFCFVMIRRHVFDEIGKFNSQFKLFYDDTDFNDRSIIAGFDRAFCSDSLAIHLGGATIWHGSEKHRAGNCLKHDSALYQKIRVF